MNDIITAIGFCNRTGNGDLTVLDASLREIADTGAEACEIGIYGEEIISGGRIIEDRTQRVAEIVRQYDFSKLSLHGQIVSNFMDREHLHLQKKVVRAMLELCNRLGAGILVHHSGAAQVANGENGADLDQMEREALAEMAEIARATACASPLRISSPPKAASIARRRARWQPPSARSARTMSWH